MGWLAGNGSNVIQRRWKDAWNYEYCYDVKYNYYTQLLKNWTPAPLFMTFLLFTLEKFFRAKWRIISANSWHGLNFHRTDLNFSDIISNTITITNFVFFKINFLNTLAVRSTNSYWCRKTLERLKMFTCYLEPSVCWNIFC